MIHIHINLAKIYFFALLCSLFLYSQNYDYKVQKIAHGLGIVWGMDFVDEDNIIFTQKQGVLSKINLKSKKISHIKGLPKIDNVGQGGLMDIKAHPNFAKNNIIFFTYVKKTNQKKQSTFDTILAQGILQNDILSNIKTILKTISNSKTGVHFGSRIAFDNNNHLFFSIGDRGKRANAQDLSTHAGSILRLNLDGNVPKDNPFINTKNAQPHIYSFGHRNPQGLFFDKKNNILYSNEHGPRGGDEINIIKSAQNFGWPKVSHGKEYHLPLHVGSDKNIQGMVDSIKTYIPSIAPSSLLVYSGKAFKDWEGNLLSTALKLKHLNRIVLKDGKAFKEYRLLNELNERLRHIIEDKKGLLCISTDSGNIYKISPK